MALRLIDLTGMPQPVSATRETGPQISDAKSKGMCGYTAAVTSSDAPLLLCYAVSSCLLHLNNLKAMLRRKKIPTLIFIALYI